MADVQEMMGQHPDECIPPDTLIAFVTGQLPRGAEPPVQAHLHSCRSCQEEAEKLRGLLEQHLEEDLAAAYHGVDLQAVTMPQPYLSHAWLETLGDPSAYPEDYTPDAPQEPIQQLLERARGFARSENLREALLAYEHIVRLARTKKDRWNEALALGGLRKIYHRLGEIRRAMELDAQAAERCRRSATALDHAGARTGGV